MTGRDLVDRILTDARTLGGTLNVLPLLGRAANTSVDDVLALLRRQRCTILLSHAEAVLRAEEPTVDEPAPAAPPAAETEVEPDMVMTASAPPPVLAPNRKRRG